MQGDCGNFSGVQAGGTFHDEDGSGSWAVGITPLNDRNFDSRGEAVLGSLAVRWKPQRWMSGFLTFLNQRLDDERLLK
jgi:hypothetical protein